MRPNERKCDNLKVMYTNADQLLNKMNCLKVHVANREMDIIIVTEVIHKAKKKSHSKGLFGHQGIYRVFQLQL